MSCSALEFCVAPPSPPLSLSRMVVRVPVVLVFVACATIVACAQNNAGRENAGEINAGQVNAGQVNAGQVNAEPEMSIADAASVIRAEFQRLDGDGDRKLTEAEFLQHDGIDRVLRRDFRLYDFDGSGFLSSTEFAAVSGLVPPSLRGRIPDPFDLLVSAAVSALDESYERWNQRPGELVNAHTFVANFLGSISPESKLFVTGRILRQADQDSDGRLSRAEAKRFLQQQLGYHWYSGPSLREATGRLLRFDRFVEADVDQSGSLTRDEYANSGWASRASGAGMATLDSFAMLDRDRNGQVSYLEFAHPDSNQHFDPIEFFRAADVNLDAELDADELFRASSEPRRHLVASTFSGFDSNEDARLTLQEYRLSLHANVNFTWHRTPIDVSRDGKLSYDEFVFHSFDLFHLQRRYYFHRLDRDADGFLDHREFTFHSRAPDSVLLGSLPGKETQLLYRDADYPHCGWPVLAPDASAVLFHRQPTDRNQDHEIVRVDLQSGELQVLAKGRQPSWSRDGQRFVCLRNRDEVWIMDSSGEPIKRVGEGVSAKWSSDGRSIAILSSSSLRIHDVATGIKRTLIERDQHEYQDLGEDVAWSPDGQKLAIAARTTKQSEIILVGFEGGVSEFLYRALDREAISGQLDWSHRPGITFTLQDRVEDTSQVHSLLHEGRLQPAPVSWLDKTLRWKSACVSHDGMWYTAVSEE
ncbi:MAG: EF-hand domain-containing protein [Planctomycetota bacterium]